MERLVRTIYFDNSQLHLLSELRRNDASRFTAFLEVWSRKNCALALSQAHLSEINRYDDQLRRTARYDLLESLLPIHSDIPVGDNVPATFLLLTNREILSALIKLDLVSLQNSALKKCAEGFPERLASQDHINLLKQLPEVDVYRNVLDAFYQANRIGAAANSRPAQTKYEVHRLSEIPPTGIKPDDVADVLSQLEEVRDSIANLDGLRDLITPGQIDGVIGGMRSTIESFVKRTEEVGSSKALAEYLGVDSTNKRNLRKPIDLLIQQHTFEFNVRHFLTDVCGVEDAEKLNQVAAKVRLEDCPGTWLKYAVQLQMRKASPIDDPSNYYDLEHLSYLPYVDVLFADKRMTTFARQVLNSDQLPPSLTGVCPPVSVPNSIEKLELAISSLA
jgi:hypothetical protein